MKEYIISIIGVSVLSLLTDIISVEKQRKYIKAVTGLVIICVLVSPILKLTGTDFFRDFEIPESTLEEGQNVAAENVAAELEKRVAEDAAKRLSEEFGMSAEVEARVRLNDEGLIERVEKILVHGKEKQGIKSRFAQVYGLEPEEVVFDG